MPKRNDINSILIIGAGPIIIGQACEFDYSGTQACKALKEEGYKVILLNSNPATIMTDPEVADITYIEPITIEFITQIIETERPCAILPTVGGQTALNIAMKLAKLGTLKKFGVELIGANQEAIEKAENRQLFKEAINRIGLSCPKNIVVNSIDVAKKYLKTISLPAIIRPSFTLGGAGGGIAHNKREYIEIVKSGLAASPTSEVLIDESVIGWKEYEMEVVRDKADNCIIVCSIENVDPMGIHTGDSITVAPALTLTDKEIQKMRNAAISVLREIGVDTGGANVQFAINPKNGEMLVIEMNPRVSRSSALASKATGFPIAKVAAKLAVGYTLDEIINDCTGTTPASFEPVVDYIVTKIPRFSFDKLGLMKEELTTSMKSVGEVMAFGRSFVESIQKALRSLETGLTGFNEVKLKNKKTIKKELSKFRPDRLLLVAEAIRMGISTGEINNITNYDKWYIEQIRLIVEQELLIKKNGLPKNKQELHCIKQMGFSDARLAELCNTSTKEVMLYRHSLNVRPVYKRVDTCAAEFESKVAYIYATYEGDGTYNAECESQISSNRKVILIGSGPNRIGQGIEFDYACVHAAYSLKEIGIEAIMINCNPETVSTDYDTCDKLYFEPLTEENILEIIELEKSKGQLLGVNIQFGGQTPLKLAKALSQAQVPILGTLPESIDLAEDRERFKQLLHKLNLKSPKNVTCSSIEELYKRASAIDYPVIVRPSYVLAGRAMKIVNNFQTLITYIKENHILFMDGPILIEEFLAEAIEIDVDAISDNKKIFILGVMEHIEEAGIHSGDSSCSLPPYSISKEMIEEIKKQTRTLALALKVIGFINVQFAIKDNKIFILEVNPRASRTLPFVAKATGIPVVKISTLVMLGKRLCELLPKIPHITHKYIAVKVPVFSFSKFPNIEINIGPEMKSTGEVMGIDTSFGAAFTKGHIASGNLLPLHGNVLLLAQSTHNQSIIKIANELINLDFTVITAKDIFLLLKDHGLYAKRINKLNGSYKGFLGLIERYKVNLVINLNYSNDSYCFNSNIIKAALFKKIPYMITISSSLALIEAIKWMKSKKQMRTKSIQKLYK